MYENDVHRIIATVIRMAHINVPAKQEGHRDGVDDLATAIMAAIESEGFTYATRS